MARIAPGNPTAFPTSLWVDAGEEREQDAVALSRSSRLQDAGEEREQDAGALPKSGKD
jgi:hypothetical protein